MDRSSLTKSLDSQAVAYDWPTLDPDPRRLARLQVCNLNLDLSADTHALGLPLILFPERRLHAHLLNVVCVHPPAICARPVRTDTTVTR